MCKIRDNNIHYFMGLLRILNKLILIKFLEQSQKALHKLPVIIISVQFLLLLLHGLRAQDTNPAWAE